ncbi:HAD family phosphatase [Fulvivirgaceae bacterium PWU5]|uniref:HAD family phosphatase n=1 Tax=Dawidia cretensis TaxID=2782350 RepID=A0AAP2E378_9BACT|nr:HAD family phosphatase [Dawidia cretensis]MBT1712235.1 HAD family phosphatase [Dawidia cretensis]
MTTVDTIIFDLGGVLIDWNPRYLYRKIFKTEEEITWFFENICTPAWNDEQDAGRSFAEATEELVLKYPDHEIAVRAWYGRWQETIAGALPDTVAILRQLKEQKSHRLYALTNWSAESFPWALANFDFLHWFEGIVVSGAEKTRKPFPEIYQILLNRYNVDPARAVFIDDNYKNIVGARAVGMQAIHFQSPAELRRALAVLGVRV